jgi:DNA polymerase III alpha subunit
MKKQFLIYKDIEGIKNTLEIAEKCNLEIELENINCQNILCHQKEKMKWLFKKIS